MERDVGRVVSLDELVRLVAAFRRNKESVALANGCFDLLHVGHVRYLQGAKLEADRLALAERQKQLEEQAALELGRIILGTGLETFSKKALARVAGELGKLGEEASLQRLLPPARSSSRTEQSSGE